MLIQKVMKQDIVMNKDTTTLSIILLIVATLWFGYIKNIVKLTRLDFESPYKAEVMRGIGIFPPVGVVMGYINIDD